MLRLVKYLKPYLLLILVAIALLFVQANADLALPDYLSKIVNIGIQQGGIASAVPEAIRESEMNKLTLFMDPKQRTLVLSDYDLFSAFSPEYSQLIGKYPAIAREPIYVLKNVDAEEISNLDPVIGKAFLVVSSIESMMSDPEKAAAISTGMGFDLSKLPAGTDIFSVLGKLPASQLATITEMITLKLDGMNESMILQSAVIPIAAEYKAIGINTQKIQTGYIFQTGLLMLLVTAISGACTIAVGFLSARVAAGLSRDLRRNVFRKVESFSSTEFDKFSTASLITRSTNDITQIQMVVLLMMRMVIYAPIIGVGGVIRALSKTTSMWWLLALAVIVLMGIILTVFSIALPKFKSIQGLIDRLNLVARENLSGMMVIRAFNMQSFEETRFDKANRDLTDVSLFINRVMVFMMPMMMLIMNGLSLLIIWVGAHEVAQAQMQVGDMMAFMQYAMQIMFAFLMMSMMFIMLPRAAVSADRVADVLETKPVIHDPASPEKFAEPFKGRVEFRKVCFRYPGAEEDVLHDISFTAQPGETTAIIGTTGSGKSTIVSLIPRFYDVSGGGIFINDIDVRKVNQRDLRDQIGYIPQKSSLFTGTIESNLLYADDQADDEVLQKATRIAQAEEFIATMPKGMQTEIAQGGMNVSGGQKQRLAIARALVKNAPIYIFDDSFSALDFKTDLALRQALRQQLAGSTLFIVTQRIATIKDAEQIIVLDEGRVVGKGTHQKLMKECEVYRSIALSQLSEEELA